MVILIRNLLVSASGQSVHHSQASAAVKPFATRGCIDPLGLGDDELVLAILVHRALQHVPGARNVLFKPDSALIINHDRDAGSQELPLCISSDSLEPGDVTIDTLWQIIDNHDMLALADDDLVDDVLDEMLVPRTDTNDKVVCLATPTVHPMAGVVKRHQGAVLGKRQLVEQDIVIE